MQSTWEHLYSEVVELLYCCCGFHVGIHAVVKLPCNDTYIAMEAKLSVDMSTQCNGYMDTMVLFSFLETVCSPCCTKENTANTSLFFSSKADSIDWNMFCGVLLR